MFATPSIFLNILDMVSIIAVALIAILFYRFYLIVSGLFRNIATAKRTGLPYVVTRK